MWIVTLLLFICFMTFCYTWYRLHTQLVRHIPPDLELEEKYQLPNEEHELTATDGLKISTWYVPVKNSKAVVILLHGFDEERGGKSHLLGHAQYLYENGYSILLVDMRAFGNSQGNKISLGVHEWKDALAGYEFVASLPENKDKPIGFLGISMGAITSIITAGNTAKGDFVIASVPQVSIGRIFENQIQKAHLPVPIFLPFLKIAGLIELGMDYQEYSSEISIKKIKSPILIISAKKDDQIHQEDAMLLYNLATSKKQLWEADAGHDVHGEIPEQFQRQVLGFLENHVLK